MIISVLPKYSAEIYLMKKEKEKREKKISWKIQNFYNENEDFIDHFICYTFVLLGSIAFGIVIGSLYVPADYFK